MSLCYRHTIHGCSLICTSLTVHILMLFLPSLATGILKGYDQLLNLVLDNTVEYMRGKLVTMTTTMVSAYKTQTLMISLRFWMRHVNWGW